MKYKTLTFGAKIALSTGMLVAVLARRWRGSLMHTIGTLSQAFDVTAGTTARKVKLAGEIDAAKSDMAVGNARSGHVCVCQGVRSARRSQSTVSTEQRGLAAGPDRDPASIGYPTRRGRSCHTWRRLGDLCFRAYAEMERLADGGDPDGAARLVEKTMAQYLALGRGLHKS